MIKKFTDPVGFSKLDSYRECPQKFHFQFVQKLPQPGSPAMERGSRMHESCEMYLNGWAENLIEEVADWKEALDGLKEKTFQAEKAWGFDKSWNLLPDWFHKDTWLRAKSDCHYIEGDKVTVIDFKSGKYRVPSKEQVELYAVCAGSVYPAATHVTAEYWYLDTGEVYKQEYTREQLLKLQKQYEMYFAPLFTDEVFKPTPGAGCRWCPYSKTKGGKCVY